MSGIEARNALIARAKELGLPVTGKNVEIAAAIVAKEKELGVVGAIDPDKAAAAADSVNQGGTDTPAEDPGAVASGEAGGPPSDFAAGADAHAETFRQGWQAGQVAAVEGTTDGPPMAGVQLNNDGTPPSVYVNVDPNSGEPSQIRTSASAWWCPVCDNSQLLAEKACANCGFERPADVGA